MRRKILLLISCLFLVISTIIVTYCTVVYGTVASIADTGEGYGLFYLASFTVESNILLGIAALVLLIATIVSMVKKTKVSDKAAAFFLIGTCAAMLTFIVVITFLAPIRAMTGRNYLEMIIGPMFFFHFFSPLVGAATYVFLLDNKIGRLGKILVLAPIFAYAIFYVVCICILHLWNDFYNFTFGGRYYITPLVFFAVCFVTYSTASLLSFLQQKLLQSRKSRA